MSVENQKKTQEALKAENKKPPQLNQKPEPPEDSKSLLKDHIHPDFTEPKETLSSPQDKKATSDSIPNASDPLLLTEQIPEGKVLINIKPREDYLKEKISSSEMSENIIKGVNTGLEVTIKNIEAEIKQNIIPFAEAPKELNESLYAKNDKGYSTMELQSRNNIIKELKAQENQLKSNIYALNQNQKMLENEGYLNLSINPNNVSTAVIDESIRKNHIKEIKLSKENLMQKLDEIAFQIKKLMSEEIKDNKKVNIKAFLDNFERDKEIAEARAKRYEQEARARRQKLERDISQLAERKRIELEKKEQEEEEQKELRVKKQKKKEKELAERRTKENNQKLLQIKVFINDKPKESSYMYKEKEKEYHKLQEKWIKTEASKRREKMQHISKEECDQFANKFTENKIKTQGELAEKALQLNELWKERKDLLPKYTSPFFTIVENEHKKDKENDEMKHLQIESHVKLRKGFGEQIMETHKPSINPKLQKERIERINKEKNKRGNKTAQSPSLDKSHEVIAKEGKEKLRNKSSWRPKLAFTDIKDNKSKRIGHSSSFVNKKRREIPDKPFNYLPEMRKKRELITERNKINGQPIDHSAKWNKMLFNENKRNIYQNMETIKFKAEKLEQEAKQKEQFLKLNGGAEKYPEIGEKVSTLLIDSIQAKLCILNSVSKSK